MNIKTLEKTDLSGLNKVFEMNAERNELEKKFANLQNTLGGHEVMLNAKDGNWVKASITGFYYNSVSEGEQVKLHMGIDDYYYKNNYNKLFNSDMFGYITLERILEWNSKYNSGDAAEVLFENIKVGDRGFIYEGDTPVEVTITDMFKGKDDHLNIKASGKNSSKSLFSLIRKIDKEFKIDVVDYLNHQNRHRDENYKLYSSGVGSEIVVR